jgi:hypothetical protein
MRAALKIRETSIVLHDIKAQQLLSTNRPFGEPLPRATNSEMHDRVVQTGKPQISDLIIGAVLRRPILTVGVPVFRDGKVAVEHCYQRATRCRKAAPLLIETSNLGAGRRRVAGQSGGP